MDSSISCNDDGHIENVKFTLFYFGIGLTKSYQHITKSQGLEMAYQEALWSADLIIKDESARRLRLRILLLENENNELHEQLALADDRIDGLEQEGEDIRAQLEVAQEDSGRHEAELRIQTRELKNLKVMLLHATLMMSY
jgi:chromosome segregation ATPase